LFSFGNKTKRFALGEMHCHDTSLAQSIPAGTIYTKLTHHTSIGVSQNITAVASVGVDNKFVIIVPGWYRISASSSSSIASPNIIFKFAIFRNGQEYSQIHSASKFPANDIRSGSLQGVIYCNIGDVIDIRARHDKISAENLTVTYANFNIGLIK